MQFWIAAASSRAIRSWINFDKCAREWIPARACSRTSHSASDFNTISMSTIIRTIRENWKSRFGDGFVVLLGGTSAMAQSLAASLVSAGTPALLVGRNPQKLDAARADILLRTGADQDLLKVLALDLESVQYAATAERIISACGDRGLSGVISFLGELGDQAEKSSNAEKLAHSIAVNFTLPAALITGLRPHLKNDRGAIAVVSSVAAVRARRSNFPYGAAKAGLDLWALGLRQKVAGSNVTVSVIRPGVIDTAMSYGVGPAFVRKYPPSAVRDGIVDALLSNRAVTYVPGWYGAVAFILKQMPEFLILKMKV
jgi:decaprenylphospho-beta-D-erythro-pentofuranosid-2-ulose 2-reductase